MQYIAFRRAALSSRTAIIAAAPRSTRTISTTVLLRDAQKPAEGAGDSFKRGAQNTGKAAGSAGKFVKEALKDVGDAAKGIFSQGRSEGKEYRKEAGDAIKKRVSSQKS